MIRIRILQAPTPASIDGVRLDCFHPGQEYEVGNLVGSLLLSEGWAEPLALAPPQPLIIADARGSSRRSTNPPNLVRDSDPPYFHQGEADERRERAADATRRPKRR